MAFTDWRGVFQIFALLAAVAAVLVAMTVSLAVGVGFGWLPARRAARLDPVQAVRT